VAVVPAHTTRRSLSHCSCALRSMRNSVDLCDDDAVMYILHATMVAAVADDILECFEFYPEPSQM